MSPSNNAGPSLCVRVVDAKVGHGSMQGGGRNQTIESREKTRKGGKRREDVPI